MPSLTTIVDPKRLFRFVVKRVGEPLFRVQPNLRGAVFFPPGHFYSPLLDIKSFGADQTHMPFDGIEYWEHLDLRPAEQRAYYEDLLERFPLLPFPSRKTETFRYYSDNRYFGISDAFTLSGVIRKEKPRRIIEIGSGFSTAVMLDTLTQTRQSASLTFIEPFPDRLHSLLSPADKSATTILTNRAQEVSLSVFDQLDPQDVLFVDSSHVAKIGSDVSFILLRILPRLKPGVIVQFHDIFYPFSYPARWIRDGRAWNESLFLRAFLLGNASFEIIAFNAFAAHAFPDLFRQKFPGFPKVSGGSIWLRKIA